MKEQTLTLLTQIYIKVPALLDTTKHNIVLIVFFMEIKTSVIGIDDK